MNTREVHFWEKADLPKVAPEHFNKIVATASDIAITITDAGRVESVIVNPLNQAIGQLDHWANRDLRDFLAEDSASRFDDLINSFRNGQATHTSAVEINHFDNTNWEFPIRYTFHATGMDGTILMLGRDLRPIAELQQRLVKAQLALEKDYESRRDYETRYRVLMETSQECLVLVEAASGRVADLNTAAAQLLGVDADALVGNLFVNEFDPNRKSDFLDRLAEAAGRDGGTAIDAGTVRTKRPVTIFPTLFRAAGDRIILCRLETENRTERADEELTDNLSTLYRNGTDAVVFCDDRGGIMSSNDAFLDLSDAALPTDVKNRSLGEFLARGQVDLKVLLDNASRTGRMRMYSTKLIGKHGAELPVDISATHLGNSAKESFAFVLRDASRPDRLFDQGSDSSNEKQMQNVVELVGSSPLKDIVSATTDVIEKMCIESAVELTGNNRVAAAEMLGLSRQSLYVKLRKYGLIDRN
ncbi:MAG: transcriptional regulator PpsR [Pseudomonadota bacterium]